MPPKINFFKFQPTAVAPNKNAFLSWETEDADDVSIDQGVGPVPAEGNRAVKQAIENDYVYTLTATDAKIPATVTANATLTVKKVVPAAGGGVAKKAPVVKKVAVAVPGKSPPVLTRANEKIPTFSTNAVKKTMEVGHKDWPKKRIRLFFHVVSAKESPADFGDQPRMERIIRKRVYRWVRRIYSQANMSPEILGIEHLPPPPQDTLAIQGALPLSYRCYLPPEGQTAAGAPSSLTLTVEEAGAAPDQVNVPLVPDADFVAIGTAVIDAVNNIGGGAKYTAVRQPVPKHDPVLPISFDLRIKANSGKSVTIKSVKHDDKRLGTTYNWRSGAGVPPPLRAVRDEKEDVSPFVIPSIEGIGSDNDADFPGGAPEQRFLLRSAKTDPSRIDMFLIPKGSMNGRAYADCELPAGEFAIPPELRRAAYVAYQTGGIANPNVVFGAKEGQQSSADPSKFNVDYSPFTLAHEIDHVLADTGHNEAEGDLMKGSYSEYDYIAAERRIYSGALKVGSSDFKSALGNDVLKTDQDMIADLHNRGGPHLTGKW